MNTDTFRFFPAEQNLFPFPFLVLAPANGFPPESYVPALRPLLGKIPLYAHRPRPFWDPDPAHLSGWGTLVEDLLRALAAEKLEGGIGVGHSMGAVTMVEAARRRPGLFRALILVDPTVPPPWKLALMGLLRRLGKEPRKNLIARTLKRKTTWGSLDEARAFFASKPLFAAWPPDVLEGYLRGMVRETPGKKAELTYAPAVEAQIYRTIPSGTWLRWMGLRRTWKGKLFLLCGEKSEYFPLGSFLCFRLFFPDALSRRLKGAGHLVPQEKPGETGEFLLWCLSKISQKKPLCEKFH